MLTRLQVDGFKNLLGFECEFGPFTCIAGPNGAGKSNVFDAIQLLSLLADHPIMEAAQLLRATQGRSGDITDIFWSSQDERADRVRLVADMIVPREVVDDFGREAHASITFLRYSVELGYEPPEEGGLFGRIVLLFEELKHLKLGDATDLIRWPHSAAKFRKSVLVGRRAGKAFISTIEDADGETVIQVHQDGGGRGKPRPSSAKTAPRTIVSTTTTASDPTILAARREFQSWRMLALEPSAMRTPDSFEAPQSLGPNGAHLAATIHRLAHTTGNGDDDGSTRIYAELANRVSQLIPARDINVRRDSQREVLVLEMRQGRGRLLPARALSDGTLRFLALCVIDADPRMRGLICMEEPENGIHPAKIRDMVNLVKGLAVDPNEEPGDDNPLRQVIVNTHSPGFVSIVHELSPGDVLLAGTAMVKSHAGKPTPTLRLRPIRDSWRDSEAEGFCLDFGALVGSIREAVSSLSPDAGHAC